MAKAIRNQNFKINLINFKNYLYIYFILYIY